jgi:hypothetical protein
MGILKTKNDTILQHNNNNNIKPKLVPMPGTMEGEHQRQYGLMKKIMMMTNVRSDLLVFRFSTTLVKKLSTG